MKCAQCELRHQGAFETKRPKKIQVLMVDSSTQTDRVKSQTKDSLQTRVQKVVTRDSSQSFLHSVGGKRVKVVKDDRVDQDSSKVSQQTDRKKQTDKTRVLTRGQMSQSTQSTQGASTSWLEAGVSLNKDVLRQEQRKDPACVDAYCWLLKGQRPEKEQILSSGLDTKTLWGNFACLVIQDGLICKKIGPLVDGSSKVTVYVPPSLRREVIRQCHDTRTSGHFYYWKTVKKVKKYFTWGGLNKDVQIYCKACQVCATRKTAGRQHRAQMRRYDVGFPMEEIAIDIMGPYQASDEGNKYVLVVVDSFSKWMEAYAVPNIEAKTIAEKLVLEFVSRFGVPYQMKSD